MIRLIHQYFRGRFERYYFKNHWHLVLDLSLTIIIICLAISAAVLYLYRPELPGAGSYAHQPIDLNNPPLHIKITPAAEVVNINDGLIIKVAYKNESTADISGWKLGLESADSNFSVSELENINNSQLFELDRQTISFKTIPAGTSGEADLKVSFQSNGNSRLINWRARNEYSWRGQAYKKDLDLPALKIPAELKVAAAAYYTSPQGDQLGIGPVPPLVGVPTNYWIFLEAQSPVDWKNMIISGRLPKGVELTDNRSLLAGDFKYNAASRQLIWKVSDLAGRTEKYRLGFEVQLVPLKNQAGQILPLVSDLRYFATDAVIGTEASGTIDRLTTNLDQDRFNAGRGQVLAE